MTSNVVKPLWPQEYVWNQTGTMGLTEMEICSLFQACNAWIYEQNSRTWSPSLHYTCSFGDLAAVYFTNVFSDIIHLQKRCPFQIHFCKKMFSSQLFDSTWRRVGMERIKSWKTERCFMGRGFGLFFFLLAHLILACSVNTLPPYYTPSVTNIWVFL